MIDEPTFCAQSLNFLYAQFKAPSMTDSWCVCPIASNDHEPLIAHPCFYDADRCIHRNDHGQFRGRVAPRGKRGRPIGRSRHHRQGLRPRQPEARRRLRECEAPSIRTRTTTRCEAHPSDELVVPPGNQVVHLTRLLHGEPFQMVTAIQQPSHCLWRVRKPLLPQAPDE